MPFLNPVTLTDSEMKAVLSSVIGGSNKITAASRIALVVGKNHSLKTSSVNAVCRVSNISDMVIKSINPKIKGLGFVIACVRPRSPIKNGLGQDSGQQLWSVYRISEAANDPCFEGIDDIDRIEENSPELLKLKTLNDWESAINQIIES